MRSAKRDGFGGQQLALIWGVGEGEVRAKRWDLGVRPVYKLVDRAAEFEAATPYYYSTYEDECGAFPVAEEDHDPRWRAQPHRPGHRV